jgi:hypothetical protein
MHKKGIVDIKMQFKKKNGSFAYYVIYFFFKKHIIYRLCRAKIVIIFG